ncbi:MAG: hypothetical protein QM479_16030 [Pseudomonadota bacterium]
MTKNTLSSTNTIAEPILCKIKKHTHRWSYWYLNILGFFVILLVANLPVMAEESVCAQVKMEIQQQASLERQAFDAVMRINNSLESVSLSNVSISINFTDELGDVVIASSDPDSTTAKFYIRIDTMQDITDIAGNGEVLAGTTAEIHWLIIPAPGSGDEIPSGKLYNVGATLNYNLGSDEHSLEVIPDTIFVKPLPKISLDYFLTKKVVSDDPFTPEVEPAQAFTLGVRVRNNGDATARNFKIDSAQPKIVDNQQGLLINFYIIGSSIDGQANTADLLLDFGDIPGKTAKVGRWQMETNLSGRFIEFLASYSHADDLGGQLTSILEGVNSYYLLHDVSIEQAGADTINDFLAWDNSILKVFESNRDDALVNNYTAEASFEFNRQEGDLAYYYLTIPEYSGFAYARFDDPALGQATIQSITRSDNKQIPTLNSWLSDSGSTGEEKLYYIHLFDYQSTGSYVVVLNTADIIVADNAPVIAFISQQEVFADETIQIVISSSDLDQTTPALNALTLPVSAQFTDNGDGSATFQWTPQFSEIGIHQLVVQASDGSLSSDRSIQINVLVPEVVDTDADQMDDNWEVVHFLNLDRDGLGDYDNDGISDLEEYKQQLEPKDYFITGLPKIVFPEMGQMVDHLQPIFNIENSSAILSDRAAISYQFEIYADDNLSELIDRSNYIKESSSSVSGYSQWHSELALEDNHWYSWRVRAYNDNNYSSWVMGYFFTNTANDNPSEPLVFSPQENIQPDSLAPVFEISQSSDADEDELNYQFLFYQDEAALIPLLSSEKIYADQSPTILWQLSQDLIILDEFYWQAIASDSSGGVNQSPVQYLSFDLNNQKPLAPTITSPVNGQIANQLDVNIDILAAIDPDNDPLEYHFELDISDKFSSLDKLSYQLLDAQQALFWPLSDLADNMGYFVRVRAFDGKAYSNWAITSFRVNKNNDNPLTPKIINPGQDSWLTSQRPVLQIAPATDPDNDLLNYAFELYTDEALTALVHSAQTSKLNYALTENLAIDQDYYWRVKALDNQGAESEWSEAHHFIINNNEIDEPEITLLTPQQDTQATRYFTIRWDDQDIDNNARIALYYSPTGNIDDITEIVSDLVENNDGKSDQYQWDIRDLASGEYALLAVITNPDNTAYSWSAAKVIKPAQLQLQTDLASPQQQGTKIQLLASFDSAHSYEYRFMLKGGATADQWQLLQDWSTSEQILWKTGAYPGLNTLRVDIRIAGEQEILDSLQMFYQVVYRWSILSLFKDTDKKIANGQKVELHAVYISNSTNYEYQYIISGATISDEYQIARPWSSNASFLWDSTGYIGSHKITVRVRETGADTQTNPDLIEKKKSLSFKVLKPQLEFTRDTEKYIEHAQQVKLSANVVSDSATYEYLYTIKGKTTDGELVILRNWSTAAQLDWDSSNYIGHHRISVSLRTPGTDQVLKKASLGFVVDKPRLALSRDSEKVIEHAQIVNLETQITSGLGSYEYQFLIKGKATDQQLVVLRDWSSTANLQWDSSNYIGSHKITAQLRPIGTQQAVFKARLNFKVKKPKVKLSRDTEKKIQHGQIVNLQVTTIQGVGNYEYRLLISGKTIIAEPQVLNDWSSTTDYIWNSDNYIGSHAITVQLREAGKAILLSVHKLSFKVQKPKIELLRNTDKNILLGQIVNLDTKILTGMANYEYQFRIKGKTTNGEFTLLQGWSSNAQFIWDSQAYQGWHRIEVSIRLQGSVDILRVKTLNFNVKP